MIAEFQREYRYLSNFWECPVMFDDVMYPSVECAYQAAKTLDVSERTWFIAMSPGQAKRAGRRVTLRPDWDRIKIDIMYAIIFDKFIRNDDLRKKLLETGDEELIEGNRWNDHFWGVCRGTGENNLGKILMRVRAECRR